MDDNDGEIELFLKRFPQYEIEKILGQIKLNEDERGD